MSGKAVENNENPYLELRKAKIERNEKILAALGLSSSSEKKNVKIQKTINKRMPIETRKSSRLKNGSILSDNTMMDHVANSVDDTIINPKKGIKRPREHQLLSKVIVQSEAKMGTTRATNIDVHKTLYSHFDYPVFIGRRLANTGKAAVVDHASLMCGIEPGSISFNKYSGVCEFKNEALFLWVNIGVPNADVKNDFLNGGRQMTWFGGSRMHEDSPVIQKLMSLGKKAVSSKELPSSCGITLWCRMHDKAGSSFEPYVCLGRLGYHSHEVGSSPVKFIWDMLDFDILMSTSEGVIGKERSLFQKIITLSEE